MVAGNISPPKAACPPPEARVGSCGDGHHRRRQEAHPLHAGDARAPSHPARLRSRRGLRHRRRGAHRGAPAQGSGARADPRSDRGSAQTRPSGPPSRQSPVLGTRADDDHRRPRRGPPALFPRAAVPFDPGRRSVPRPVLRAGPHRGGTPSRQRRQPHRSRRAGEPRGGGHPRQVRRELRRTLPDLARLGRLGQAPGDPHRRRHGRRQDDPGGKPRQRTRHPPRGGHRRHPPDPASDPGQGLHAVHPRFLLRRRGRRSPGRARPGGGRLPRAVPRRRRRGARHHDPAASRRTRASSSTAFTCSRGSRGGGPSRRTPSSCPSAWP